MTTLVNEKVYEWKGRTIKGLKLCQEDRIFLNKIKSKVEILEIKEGLKVIPKNWIGVIKLSEFILEIRPKFDENFELLPYLISYTNSRYNILNSMKEYKIQRNDNLLELIVKMFIFELQQILIKGLKRDYNQKQDDILTVKGKVNFTKQIQQNLNLPLPISCIYDEYDYNNIENQIILLTLEFLSSIRLNYNLKKEIKVFCQFFQQICSVNNLNISLWTFKQIRYHRQNSYYQELHNFCRFLLFKHGIEDIYAEGNQNIFCFLLDMNFLFQEFVYRLLDEFSNKDVSITNKTSNNKAITHMGKDYHSIRPDILVHDQYKKILELIDVKYKRYGFKDAKISSSDIYQLYFYSSAFFSPEQDTMHCKIVYFIEDDDKDKIELMLNTNGHHRSKLKAVGIDIKNTLLKIIEDDKVYLKKIVEEIIF